MIVLPISRISRGIATTDSGYVGTRVDAIVDTGAEVNIAGLGWPDWLGEVRGAGSGCRGGGGIPVKGLGGGTLAIVFARAAGCLAASDILHEGPRGFPGRLLRELYDHIGDEAVVRHLAKPRGRRATAALCLAETDTVQPRGRPGAHTHGRGNH